MSAVRFTAADVETANAAWGANCGPAALAAICGLTLDESRAASGSHWPGYTTPTVMLDALRSAKRSFTVLSRSGLGGAPLAWPSYGICRIQWEGPWLQPEVPMRARYRYTHWIGVSRLHLMDGSEDHDTVCIWDVNVLGHIPSHGDGWSLLPWWSTQVAPLLVGAIKRASGGWHITHAIEVERQRAPAHRGQTAGHGHHVEHKS